MNPAFRLFLLAGALALSACDQNSAPAAQEAAPASQAVPAADSGTELKDKDGKITVKTFGSYTDKTADAAALPEGVTPEQLLLLQHNADYNTGVYIAKLGKTEQSPEAYFGKLKKAVESGKGLINIGVDAQDKPDRLSYRFSQTDANDDITLNESCTTLLDKGEIYNVCAFSTEVQPDDLAEIIKDISLKP